MGTVGFHKLVWTVSSKPLLRSIISLVVAKWWYSILLLLPLLILTMVYLTIIVGHSTYDCHKTCELNPVKQYNSQYITKFLICIWVCRIMKTEIEFSNDDHEKCLTHLSSIYWALTVCLVLWRILREIRIWPCILPVYSYMWAGAESGWFLTRMSCGCVWWVTHKSVELTFEGYDFWSQMLLIFLWYLLWFI